MWTEFGLQSLPALKLLRNPHPFPTMNNQQRYHVSSLEAYMFFSKWTYEISPERVDLTSEVVLDQGINFL